MYINLLLFLSYGIDCLCRKAYKTKPAKKLRNYKKKTEQNTKNKKLINKSKTLTKQKNKTIKNKKLKQTTINNLKMK